MLAAVKVVTFLTMPLEPDTEHRSMQARLGRVSGCSRVQMQGTPQQMGSVQVTYMQDVKVAFLAQDALFFFY